MIHTSNKWKKYSKDIGIFHIRAELVNGTNLYDINTVTEGGMLVPTGQIVTNPSYFFTDFIKVEDGVTYNTNLQIVVMYNSGKQAIGGGTVSSKTFTASVTGYTVEYVRLSAPRLYEYTGYVYESSSFTQLTDEDFMMGSVSISDSVSGMGEFNVGSVIASQFNGTLNNIEGKFDGINLVGAKLNVKLGIQYNNNSSEWIDRGAYTLEKPRSLGSTIEIVGYDNLVKFDRYYTGKTNTVANAFDKTTITDGMIVQRNGEAYSSPGEFHTDYIPIPQEGTYYTNFEDFVVMYGVTGRFMGYRDFDGGAVTIPSGVAYVICNGTTANVNSYYFNSTYADITLPQSVVDFVPLLCNICGVEFDTSTASNLYRIVPYYITPFEFDENTTCRDVLSWIAQISGAYFRADPTGRIQCMRFDLHEWESTSNYDGGTFDPWSTTSDRLGGTTNPWDDSTDYDGGSTGGSQYSVENIKTLDIYFEDITVTGVRAFAIDTVGDLDPTMADSIFADVNYDEVGSHEYMLEITDNNMISFLNGAAFTDPESVASRVNFLINGFTMRPFSAQIIGDPSIEAGDIVALKNYRGVEYISIITDLTYVLNSNERLECNAKDPEEMNSQRIRI